MVSRACAAGWLALLSLAGSVQADAGGAQASALVRPYEGSVLMESKVDAFDAYWRIVGVLKGEPASPEGAERLEGRLTRLRYANPKGRSTLEIERNYRQALEAEGLKVDYACARREACGNQKRPTWTSVNGINLGVAGDVRYFTGRMGDGAYVAMAINPGTTYLHVLEPAGMETGKVTVDAAALARGLDQDGRVELAGIHFDTGRASLRPDSDAALAQAAQLLAGRPELKLAVIGHTDDQGGADFNLALSRQRAQAVVDALVGRGVDRARLLAEGRGLAQPLASNASEEGRARNRRVELVRR